MKKKSLITAIVALLALIAFTGCDPILEAFYPEFTAGGENGGGDKGISVWVEVEVPAEGLGDIDPIIGAVLVEPLAPGVQGEPTPVGGNYDGAAFSKPDWTYDDEAATWILSAALDFFNLADGDYQVLVWLETTGDYKPAPVFEGTEPQATATWYWWNEAGEPSDEGNVFMFPNTYQAKWLEGYAFIPLIGAGGPLDPVFYVTGEFTVDKDWRGQETYTVAPRDANRILKEMEMNLYSLAGGVYTPITGFADYALNGAASTTFSVNYSSIPEIGGALTVGDYWIEVWVLYGDGTDFWRTYPLRVLDEATSGSSVWLNVHIGDLDDWPFYLQTDKSYSVTAEVIRAGSVHASNSGSVWLSPSPAYFQVNASSFSSLQLFYNPNYDNSGTTNDWVRIKIDVDGNGTFNGADLILNWPIGISVAEAGTGYTMKAYAYDMVRMRE